VRSYIFALSLLALLTAAACNNGSPTNNATVSNNASPNSSSIPSNVTSAIETVLAKPAYAHSRLAALVVDRTTGDVLLDRDAGKMFVPGSIMKTFSTTAALKAYGPDYRFHTPVYAIGGNLVLVASGDFSMGLRDRGQILAFNSFPEIDHNYADTGLPGPALLKNSNPLAGLNALAAQVRASGTRSVRDVVIDDRLFKTYDGWPDGLISPIWFNENVIDITVAPTDPGEAPAVDWRPKVAGVRVVPMVTTVAANAKTTPLAVQAGANGVLTVTGTIAAGAKPSLTIWQIPKPADFARTAFIEALQRAGVTVSANATGANPSQLLPSASAYGGARKVAERVSPPLSQFVKVVLKLSYNRGADLMVCLVALKNGSRNCADGLANELQTITALGVSPQSTYLYDGAGGVDAGRTTPADEVALLRNTYATPWGRYLYNGMAVMGVDGTQAENQAGTPVAGHIRLKDGTRAGGSPDGQALLVAKTEVGYIDAKSGRQLVYAVFLNDIPIGPSGPMDALVSADRDLSNIAAAIQQNY
jgi:D-alanyl-D-alanine carboxypeptidase/D-alanyl-D-alanine-endopeptidase (penicillin-binding protein 4)